MSAVTFSNLSADSISAYIAAKTLQIALKELVLYAIGEKGAMQFNSGRTFQYSRYERVVLPQTALSEGVTPGDTAMSVSTVTAVLDQWGAVIPLTDVAIDSIKHPVLQIAIGRGALQAKETIDREVFKVLITGTNVFFPNAISARSSLTSSDKLSSASAGKVVAALRAAGAAPHDGDLYVGVVDPWCEEDMLNDSTFVSAAVYGGQKKLMVGEIGTWKGVRWMRCNSMPVLKYLAAPTAASSATAGTLPNSTAYDLKIAVVDANTGHETFMSVKQDVTTASDQESIDVTIPALPAGATAGSKFRLYFGADAGVLYLKANDISPSTTYNIATVPATSGPAAQVNAPTGVPVHMNFIFGKEGFAVVELNKMQGFLTPAVASDSDPLVQRRKTGWKCDFKTVILAEQFMARLETYATNNP